VHVEARDGYKLSLMAKVAHPSTIQYTSCNVLKQGGDEGFHRFYG
jgi:hypothetical protein